MTEVVQKSRSLLLFAALILLIICPSASAQFSMSKQSRAIFSGQLVDAKTGEPLIEATVFIRTQYGDVQAKTDSAGTFLLEVDDAKDLENFLILFSHPDYRQKDINALLADAFHDKARFSLLGGGKGSSAKVKYKKNDL